MEPPAYDITGFSRFAEKSQPLGKNEYAIPPSAGIKRTSRSQLPELPPPDHFSHPTP
jgi:hypothetical protein